MKIVKNLKKFEEFKLSEITIVKDGTHDSPKYIQTGIPFITSKNLINDSICFKNVQYISNEDHNKFYKRSDVKKNDVLIGMIGTIGNPVVVNTDNVFSIKNVALIKENNILDSHLIKYQLENNFVKSQIKELLSGGVLSFLKLSDIRSLKLKVPSKENQYKIKKVLSDSKNIIDRIKDVLEKMELRKNYYADNLTSGAILLSENEKIIIKNFDNIINEHKKSKVMAGAALKEGDYPFFNCSKKQTLYSNEYLIDDNVLLLSTGGNPSVNYYSGKLSYSTDVWCLNSKYSKYLYYFYNANIHKIEQCFQGGGLKHLSKKDFKKIEITIPDNDKSIQDIVDYLDKLNDEKEKVEKLLKLEEQRFEWLSDKLLSGEYIIED